MDKERSDVKIEVGKSYRTRDGRKAVVLDKYTSDLPYPVLVLVGESESAYFYDEMGNCVAGESSKWDLVAEWVDEPKTWGEMSPEEKGALLLAELEGKQIQMLLENTWKDVIPQWASLRCYRVKPEPEVFKVTLQGGNFRQEKDYWSFRRDGHIGDDTHKITFSLVDEEPDCGSIKMEKIRNNEE